MVYLKLLIITQVFSFLLLNTNEPSQLWAVESESNIKIKGTTNLNKFVCKIAQYGKKSILKFATKRSKHGHYNVEGHIVFPVDNFDCGHRIMTHDFKKTLNSSAYPDMRIAFKNVSSLPSTSPQCIKVGLEIQLAECVKNITIDFEPSIKNHDLVWKGNVQLQFSDFDLDPPSKFGGSIKVKNDLDVEISLNLSKN